MAAGLRREQEALKAEHQQAAAALRERLRRVQQAESDLRSSSGGLTGSLPQSQTMNPPTSLPTAQNLAAAHLGDDRSFSRPNDVIHLHLLLYKYVHKLMHAARSHPFTLVQTGSGRSKCAVVDCGTFRHHWWLQPLPQPTKGGIPVSMGAKLQWGGATSILMCARQFCLGCRHSPQGSDAVGAWATLQVQALHPQP